MFDECYPFAAVAGQERAKRALMLSLVNPGIGGVLLSGEKGTAKSTLVRGIAQIAEKEVVNLPLNATEDMLAGSVDFEAAVRDGQRRFAGGILEHAHGNILYVDEVNLLPDSLASAVSCAVSAGENVVEREGISHRHDCSFLLIGTMNPEEGPLSPQLLDRFGLCVEIRGETSLEERARIVRRRIDYERDPAGFLAGYREETKRLKKTLTKARLLFPETCAGDDMRILAAEMARDAGCEGNRAELLLTKTALAAAALDGRRTVTAKDVAEAAEYVLPHRRRDTAKSGTEKGETGKTQGSTEKREADKEGDGTERPEKGKRQETVQTESAAHAAPGNDGQAGTVPMQEPVRGENRGFVLRLPEGTADRIARKGAGRRYRTEEKTGRGKYAGITLRRSEDMGDLALDATVRAAAPFQKNRESRGCAITLCDEDLRFKRRKSRAGATVLFAVDASGSMGAARRMKDTKEAVLSMLMDSYQKRDKVGFIAFRGQRARVLLNFTSSVDLAQKALQALPVGGRTPLADALYRAWQLFRAQKRRDPEMRPLLVLVTDARANSSLWSDDPVEDALNAARLIAGDAVPSIVVDTENDFISFGLGERIAQALGGNYFKAGELKSAPEWESLWEKPLTGSMI